MLSSELVEGVIKSHMGYHGDDKNVMGLANLATYQEQVDILT